MLIIYCELFRLRYKAHMKKQNNNFVTTKLDYKDGIILAIFVEDYKNNAWLREHLELPMLSKQFHRWMKFGRTNYSNGKLNCATNFLEAESKHKIEMTADAIVLDGLTVVTIRKTQEREMNKYRLIWEWRFLHSSSFFLSIVIWYQRASIFVSCFGVKMLCLETGVTADRV